ncbi:MAG: MFS transporter [Paracoccaceae bacterium]|nr:MFS transporter [Paracoccaceae bacterium]
MKRRMPAIAYILYDWAISPLPTLHTTFIFSIFFVQAVAPNEILGNVWWSWMIAACSFTIAIISPLAGADGDRRGTRKRWLLFMTLISAGATSCLWFVLPTSELTEQAQNWMIILTLVLSYFAIVTNDGVYTFYNALLPAVAERQWLGRVSGWAFGIGYISGLLALFCALPVVAPGMFGLSEPLFGISTDDATNIRITMPFVSLWLIVFSIPLFVFCPEPEKADEPNFKETFNSGLKAVVEIPGLLRFLVARMFYADALVVVFAMGGIYAGTEFGFSIGGATAQNLIVFGIVLNLTSGLGAILGGYSDDFLGSYLTLRISLICLALSALAAILTSSLFVFWIAGSCLGLFIGPVQSCTRVLVANAVPRAELRSRIFGLFMLSGKATSFIGPLLYGVFVSVFETSRAGMSVALILLILGFILLAKVPPGQKTYPNQ